MSSDFDLIVKHTTDINSLVWLGLFCTLVTHSAESENVNDIMASS